MNNFSCINSSLWECKYYVVGIPKYRKKALCGHLIKYLGQVFKDLDRNREFEVLEGHMMPDHAHMPVPIPPKYAVAQVIGYINGKSAVHVARNYLGKKKNFTGSHFWGRGYHVSIVGRDEQMIREYIRAQEQEDRRIDQLNLFKWQGRHL